MNAEIFVKPGWKNFLMCLLLWYIGVTVYILLNRSTLGIADLFLYYTEFSWPNFIITYLVIIWIVPQYLYQKKYGLLILMNLLLLAGYILLRYFNNNYFIPDYYQYVDSDGNKSKERLYNIVASEYIRGLSFMFVGYTYRFAFDWGIIERKKRLIENEKLKSDLAMLRYQVNPHFLFNAINNIYYLSIINSPSTPDSLLKLSELMRYVLYEKDDWVPLQKEIEHLERMIDFHLFRFPNEVIKFNVCQQKSGHFTIPPLLLSTFIENAFKHGAPGTDQKPLVISLETRGNQLKYRVLNAVKPNLSKDAASGIGLANLEKRLELLYPNLHQITLLQNKKCYFASLEISLANDQSNSS